MGTTVEGKKQGIKDFGAADGQTINRATALDTSSLNPGAYKDTLGVKKMAGGTDSLDHSIKGAKANMMDHGR